MLESDTMMLPALAPGCGLFPDHTDLWIAEPGVFVRALAALRPQGDLTLAEPLPGDIQTYRKRLHAALEPHP